jgi:hypothetical protein
VVFVLDESTGQKAGFGVVHIPKTRAKSDAAVQSIVEYTRTIREGRSGIYVMVSTTDQAWFWTPAWQAGEAEASHEISEGQGRIFESSEDFLASFDS